MDITTGAARRGLLRAVVPVLVLLGTPSAASAAQEGGGTAIFSLDLGLIIWTWVLFLLTLGVLAWKVFPAISGSLEERQRKIQEAIDSARQDREEARRLLEEHRQELREARQEAQEILAEGRQAGQHLREEILEEARQEREAMMERTRREMEREREKLREELRGEVADVAIAAAERLLEERLDDEASRRLVQQYVTKIG
jgi:F-type H+-transporting ATPase subunit b